MFELAQYGGAFFVAGLALVIIYKLLEVYVFPNNGNGNGKKMEQTLGYINVNIMKVRKSVDIQTALIREKFDNMSEADHEHDMVTQASVDKLEEVQKSVDECKKGVEKCHDEIIRGK